MYFCNVCLTSSICDYIIYIERHEDCNFLLNTEDYLSVNIWFNIELMDDKRNIADRSSLACSSF